MPATELHVNEPKRVRTISIDRLVERLLRCRETWPDARIALNELNQCLDFYQISHKPGPLQGDHIYQFLWE